MKRFLSIGTTLITIAASVFGLSGCGQSNMVQEISYTVADSSDILYKCEYEGEIKNGTKLVVAENQMLILFKDGKVISSYTTGQHVVHNDNYVDYNSSEIYFLNNTPQENIKWNITDPIAFVQDDYGDVEMIGYGDYSYSFDNPTEFVETYLNSGFNGTASEYIANTITETVKNIVSATNVNDMGALFAALETDNIKNNLPNNGVEITLSTSMIKYTEESQQKINKINTELLLGYTPEFTTPPQTTAPTTSINTISFNAQVHVLSKAEDGRHTPFFTNYKPELIINDEAVMATCKSLDGKEMVMPGEDVVITFEITSSMQINTGDEITMREGGRVIGTGVVTEIL